MDDFSKRRQQALEACEKVINGIEDDTLFVSSALLLCKKIARLVNDMEGQEWLEYEYRGYPRTKKGLITPEGWQIGLKYGRGYYSYEAKKELMFVELASELEETVNSSRSALGNYSTQGFSVSGDQALIATERMTLRVAQNTNDLLCVISEKEKRLLKLKAQYYDFALKWQIELCFGNTSKGIFDEYRETVDRFYLQLPTVTLQKLNAIEDMIEDGNPERYAQVLTSCRRLWSDTAKYLFNEILPDYGQKTFKTASGKEIDISGDHDNNKLSAIIETLQSKAAKNTLVGSTTLYLVDWIEQINNRQNTGVHADISRSEAIQP